MSRMSAGAEIQLCPLSQGAVTFTGQRIVAQSLLMEGFVFFFEKKKTQNTKKNKDKKRDGEKGGNG